ncbi:hypothetical protein [Cylindrospermum sp. FACHB-282]|nr:hypothetical protein [Cylindrospermum sp. FACHB-282]MBD2386935.1 hypothetical protein [Cylindrospermum sp. FACHB-282]
MQNQSVGLQGLGRHQYKVVWRWATPCEKRSLGAKVHFAMTFGRTYQGAK